MAESSGALRGPAAAGGAQPAMGPRRTGSADAASPQPIGDRLTYALRQSLLMGGALLLAGQLTERLRPAGLPVRGILDTPFLWAIATWVAVLLFHAVAFDRTQLKLIEGRPFTLGVAAGVAHLAIGLVTLDDGGFGRRLLYLVTNATGAAAFWWALFSLGALLVVVVDRR